MSDLKDTIGAILLVPFALLWAFGGLIGALIEASRSDLVGVVLAIFIPGYGAIVTVIAIFRHFF